VVLINLGLFALLFSVVEIGFRVATDSQESSQYKKSSSSVVREQTAPVIIAMLIFRRPAMDGVSLRISPKIFPGEY